MRLKRLVARGFKSFADRTEFEFDTRLTGIIGPNGCGKSNVVDAIKWVLGDQRAKSLRGAEMTDVIFKGAEGREPMGMAEVVITFEDPSGQIDGRTEVDIARRLTLDKESTYLLNGNEVRLKDVRDVLLDTGLGTGGYSVMEQGRIDAVLSANPEARRAIFEEAAGIARFKLQKKEALRKLERTDQNLARVTDLLEERARRIRSLRIQAGRARRWQELHATLRDLRAALAVVDGRALREQAARLAAQLAELQARLLAIEGSRSEAAALLAAGDQAISAAAAALEGLQQELQRCQGELLTHRERGSAQQQRSVELRAESARAQQRQAALHEQRSERAAVLAEVRDALAGKESELIELHKQLADQRQLVHGVQAALRAQQQQREQLRQSQLELLHARTRARNGAADQEAKQNAAAARLLRLQERQQALAAELEQQEQQRHGFVLEQGDGSTRERLLVEREQRTLEDLGEADSAAAVLAQGEADLRRELSEVEGRQLALQGMESHFEGLDQGPRRVLQQQPAGLRGRLLDLLEIDLAYSTALEAALGENVQALVVDTRSHAEAIAQQLQSERSGRVLLLVEQEFGPELAQAPSLLPLPEGARFLLDLVKPVGSSPASQRLLGWLLRGVALVPSLAHAASNRPDLCFVTPDGSLLCGPRLEGGASAEGHTGLVVRRSQILKLGEQKLEVQQRLERLQVGKDAAASRVETLKLELRQIGSALAAARRRGQEIEGQLARLSARDADLLRERSDLDGEAQELRRQRFLATALLGRCLLDAHLLARAEAVLQAQEQTFSTDIATAQAAAEAAARAEQELRLQQVQAGEAREGQLRSSRMHEEALQELERALQELASTAQSAAAGAERAAAEQARLLELGEQVARELAGFEAQRQDCVRTLDGARAERSARQQTLEQWDQQRSSLHDQASAARLELAEHEHRFARLEERLREDCEVELRRCLLEVHGIGLEDPAQFPGPVPPPDVVETLAGPPLPPAVVDTWYSMQRLWQLPQFQPADARKEAQVLQAQKERLGAVNLDAVRELDEEEGQFTTLEQEVGDLKSARTSLLETLRKLETESKLLFEQTFTEARKNFQEIFRKLFQGGKADMYLSQLQDGDSLEAGIEIVAQPPGKQLQSINLLSGGERSLTAVAILFALFKVRPSPFCILDEVDAALDETNVERFLRVLRDFITDTQFCIVTHHKRTMAECQVLYGITMQRRGVSSRIAVALHEVDGFKQGSGNGNRLDPAAKKRIAGEEAVGF